MKFCPSFLAVLLFGVTAGYASADQSWALVDVTTINPEARGVLNSNLSISSVEDGQDSVTLSGQIIRENISQIEVTLPTSIISDLDIESGIITTDTNAIQYRLISSSQPFDNLPITTRIYSLISETGEQSIVTIHDDPLPLLPLAIAGGAYMLVCGGLFVASMQTECSDTRGLNIGIEYGGATFGCSISCSAEQ